MSHLQPLSASRTYDIQENVEKFDELLDEVHMTILGKRQEILEEEISAARVNAWVTDLATSMVRPCLICFWRDSNSP
jgi:hypothetical protein